MNQIIIIISFAFIFFSCNRRKYEMNNALPEMVDVTGYIESGEFIPDSCEGRLEKLIKTKPFLIDKRFESELQNRITKWKNSIKSSQSLFEKTTYQYSYIMISDPIDVYKTELETKNNVKISFYIRMNQKGDIISDYSENNWVENNCD